MKTFISFLICALCLQTSFAEAVYIVKRGDTLWKIAEKHCSSPFKWRRIFNANRAVIPSPEEMEIGTELTIPDCGKKHCAGKAKTVAGAKKTEEALYASERMGERRELLPTNAPLVPAQLNTIIVSGGWMPHGKIIIANLLNADKNSAELGDFILAGADALDSIEEGDLFYIYRYQGNSADSELIKLLRVGIFRALSSEKILNCGVLGKDAASYNFCAGIRVKGEIVRTNAPAKAGDIIEKI